MTQQEIVPSAAAWVEDLMQQYAVVVLLSAYNNHDPPPQLPLWLSAQADADAIPMTDDTSVALCLPGFRGMLSYSDDSCHPLKIPDSWEATLGSILADWDQRSEGQRTLAVCGAKNVGKSTLARIIINRFLSPDTVTLPQGGVLLLDCDLGQPEFTPPGFISLIHVKGPILGPPHTHLTTPLESYFVGDVSWKTKPNMLDVALKVLLAIYRSSWSHLPLVVNLDGWVKGLGEELLHTALSLVEPTELICLKGFDR